MSADPFANTTTVKNILQHIISPKIVSDGAGGYITKTDLVNVHNILFASPETTRGDESNPVLTGQCGTYTLTGTEGPLITFQHSRVTPNSIIFATVLNNRSVYVVGVIPPNSATSNIFSIKMSGTIDLSGTKIGWFIASF